MVNADEAEQVRATFQLYLERGSLRATVAELRRRGWHNKTFTTVANKTAEGGTFTNATLHALLTNVLYIGRVRCGDDLVAGAHDAIVNAALWDAVQARLRGNAVSGGANARNCTGALLRGLLRCGRCGSAMVHSFSTSVGKRHRYYECAKMRTEGATTCPGSRLPAGKFEAFVAQQIRAIGTDETLLAKTAEAVARTSGERIAQLDAELRRGEQERRRLDAQRADLLRTVPPTAEAARPLLAEAAAIEEQLGVLAQRQDEALTERQALSGGATQSDLRDALAGFTPVWDQLFPGEQERVLRLLIEQITYDPDTGDAHIELPANGITTLAEEARTTA